MRIKVSPSLLACDFARLGEEIARAEAAGADAIHVDVMDGHFVPNITVGPPVIAKIRDCTRLPLDVHLMIDRPDKYATRFADSGAAIVTFHVEAPGVQSREAVLSTFADIRSHGAAPGIVVKPATPAESIFPYLDQCSMALVMTVEPGFGGQEFMHGMLPKTAMLRREAERLGISIDIEVDGGIDEITAPLCAENGANVFVAGSFLFGHDDMAKRIANLHALSTP